MNAQTLTTFFALLALGSLAAAVCMAIGAVVLRVTGGPPWLASLRSDIGGVALRVAPLVAGTATLGSLWYSEVMNYRPCVLCWGQRIFMYSLAVVLTVGALRKDLGVRWYGLALAIPGAAIAAYHTWVQAYPGQTPFCTLDAPCDERVVWVFGFVSLPMMALGGFMLVIALLLAATGHPAAATDIDGGLPGDDKAPRPNEPRDVEVLS